MSSLSIAVGIWRSFLHACRYLPPFRYFTSTVVIPDGVDQENLGDLLPRALFCWQMEFVEDVQGVEITLSGEHSAPCCVSIIS